MRLGHDSSAFVSSRSLPLSFLFSGPRRIVIHCFSACAHAASTLKIVDDLVVMILKRAEMGKNYGVVMLPEGLIEFIPEFNALISDINDVLASGIPTTIGEGILRVGVVMVWSTRDINTSSAEGVGPACLSRPGLIASGDSTRLMRSSEERQ